MDWMCEALTCLCAVASPLGLGWNLGRSGQGMWTPLGCRSAFADPPVAHRNSHAWFCPRWETVMLAPRHHPVRRRPGQATNGHYLMGGLFPARCGRQATLHLCERARVCDARSRWITCCVGMTLEDALPLGFLALPGITFCTASSTHFS